jgi:hypothetical protein
VYKVKGSYMNNAPKKKHESFELHVVFWKFYNTTSIVAHIYKFICEFPLHAAVVHGLVQQSIAEY